MPAQRVWVAFLLNAALRVDWMYNTFSCFPELSLVCACFVRVFEKTNLVQALRPTVMPVVPRVMNRLHDKIVQGALAAGGVKAKLFIKACEAKVSVLDLCVHTCSFEYGECHSGVAGGEGGGCS